ncbi:MAG: phosphate ABC transporter substrate-binding protein PstS [Thermoleophilia bacterium]
MKNKGIIKIIAVVAALLSAIGVIVVAAGCGSSGSSTGGGSDSAQLTGAGSTFAYPIYSKWFDEYSKVQPGVTINYQSIGSGAGIQQFTAQTVDWGATDAPMTDSQIAKAPREVLHIPTVAGAVAITYNVKGVPNKLKLSPDVLSRIYLGQIKNWNDPALKADNPGVNFPDEPIVTVHRSDGSGTTNIYTSYLSAVSPDWKSEVGASTDVKWPVGLGGKGSEGVTGQVKQSEGSIGYVELSYAKQNNLPYALIKNKAGNFVEPTLDNTKAAIQTAVANMPADFRSGSVGNPDGANAYPIAGFTYILVYKDQQDQAKGKALVDFLWWGIHDGQQFAASLDYVALPPQMVTKVEAQIRKINYKGQSLAPAS